MWNRRRFLESLSAVPWLGGFAGAGGGVFASVHGGACDSEAAAAAAAAAGGVRRDYFREMGIRPFINAAGTYTAMTASLMPPEVMDAIAYASKQFVMLDELHDRVGERIATLLSCEAAMVTAGAASAMTLGTAAVLTGTDKQKIGSLPNLTAAGMKSEVIIQKAHRFGYDHAVRACGVRLVEVETRDELERAVNGQTAMMLFFNAATPPGQIAAEEFAKLGNKHGIPTLNDCAADVPPIENFWKYTKMGFDLVTFSGGKGIRGPQSAGLLLGRKDLIAAARLNGPPNAAIGRGMKVNKEEMLGMLVALERFLKLDEVGERREYDRRASVIVKSVSAVPGVKAEIFVPEIANHVPHIRISWPAAAGSATAGKTGDAATLVKAMRDGDPSIAIRAENDTLVVGVWMLRPGEDTIVAKRLRQVLEARG